MKTYSFQPWAVVFKICDAHLYSPSCSPSLCGYLMCLKSTLETLANKFWYAACVIPTLLHIREQNKGSEMPPEPSTASPLNWAQRTGREWAVGPKHVQHTRNTTQAQDRLLPAEGGDLWGGSRVPMWTPCSQRFFSLIWLLITTLLGTAPLKSIQPISIQTMKWKPKNAESNPSAGPG